ncbi:MAG: hypothetical protein AAB381_00910 [Patescibacteria group bacterium]
MKIKVIKLGTECEDKATKTKGRVTHWICDMEYRIDYLFQPHGTSPEDGQPIKKLYLETARLQFEGEPYEEVEVPVEILGTQVTDKASGFTGMAVSFLRSINGCFHVFIQPSTIVEKTGCPVAKTDFDLRECEGAMITQLQTEELERSRVTTPSPEPSDHDRFRLRNPLD